MVTGVTSELAPAPKNLVPTNVSLVRSQVSIHNQLMSPRNLLEVVVMVELLRHIGPKVEPSSSERRGPAGLFMGIRPHQVAHGPVGGDFLHTVQCTDVVQFVDDRGQSSVQTEYRVVWG